MKYRTISLNGNKEYSYNLVKFNNFYREQLEELRKLDSKLADYVYYCPNIYSELSDHQSYMILRGYNYIVGAINIETSCDEKNLEVEIHLDEKKFNNREEMVNVIEQIIDSLGVYFYDKENIVIRLINEIDLSEVKSWKYMKNAYTENLVTYTCSNLLNNRLYSNLLLEMNSAEETFSQMGQSWTQEIKLVDDMYENEFDDKLFFEYFDGKVPNSEIFFKAKVVSWNGITSNKCIRSIDFHNDGCVRFSKVPKKGNGIYYEFNYNVLWDKFDLVTKDKALHQVKVEENWLYTKIEKENVTFVKYKEDGNKKIVYVSPEKNNSSVVVELYLDDNNEIKKCYIDIRTHKNSNHKINGQYILRILSDYNILRLDFVNRKGAVNNSLVSKLEEDEKELFSTIQQGNITPQLINEIISKVLCIANKDAVVKERQRVELDDKFCINDILKVEQEVVDFVKQLIDEIPLINLKGILEKFVASNNIQDTKAKDEGSSLVKK